MTSIFNGKVALVTGASGGMGRALCLELIRCGAHVVATDIDGKALAALRETLQDFDLACLTVVGDITEADFAGRLCTEIEEKFGRLDFLIHNAGVTHFSLFPELGTDRLTRVLEINFLAAVRLTEAALPLLEKTKGQIAALSSVAGFAPLYGRTAYAASKHALQGFFESLRGEVAPLGISITLACPSFVASQPKSSATAPQAGLARPGSATETAGQALSPEYVATQICRAMEKKRRCVFIGRLSKLSYLVSRFSPALYEWLMLKNVRQEIAR